MLHNKFSDEDLAMMAKGSSMIMPYNKTTGLRASAVLACRPFKDDGGYDVFSGSNVVINNGPNISAEVCAGILAIQAGHWDFVKIAICTNSEDYTPSAETLAFLREFATSGDLQIITLDEYDDIVIRNLSDLERGLK